MELKNVFLQLNIQWGVLGLKIFIGAALTVFIYALISRYQRRNRLKMANLKLMDSIIPSVREGVIPNLETVKSLIAATANKFSIPSEHILSAENIRDNLIKDIMDCVYLSSQAKNKLCEKITATLPDSVKEKQPANPHPEKKEKQPADQAPVKKEKAQTSPAPAKQEPLESF